MITGHAARIFPNPCWPTQAYDVLRNDGARAVYNRQLRGQAREREEAAAAAARARAQPQPPRDAPRGPFEVPQCGEREWVIPVSLQPPSPITRSSALAPERAPQQVRGVAVRRARVVHPGRPHYLLL